MLIRPTKIQVSFVITINSSFKIQMVPTIFYDEEQRQNLKYLYQEMKKQEQYFIKKLTFDDLNEVAEIFGKLDDKS